MLFWQWNSPNHPQRIPRIVISIGVEMAFRIDTIFLTLSSPCPESYRREVWKHKISEIWHCISKWTELPNLMYWFWLNGHQAFKYKFANCTLVYTCSNLRHVTRRCRMQKRDQGNSFKSMLVRQNWPNIALWFTGNHRLQWQVFLVIVR